MKWPSTQTREALKLNLELLLLLMLVPLVLYTLVKDRKAGLQLALNAR